MPGPARNRTAIQQRNAAALAPNSSRLELRGAPSDLVWPPLCASCGAEAEDAITGRKCFARPRRFGHRVSRRIAGYVVTEARFPVCNTCAAQHHAEVQIPSMGRKLLRSFLTPLLIPLAGFLWLGNLVFGMTLDLPPGDSATPLAWGLTALIGVGIVWTLWAAWCSTVPQRIEKQTEIARACDFSDDVSGFFEPRRHIYAIRNPAFAQGLADFNAEHVWTEDDDAIAARKRTRIFLGVIAALTLYWLYVVFAP